MEGGEGAGGVFGVGVEHELEDLAPGDGEHRVGFVATGGGETCTPV